MDYYLRYEVHNCDVQSDRSYFYSRDLFPLAYVEVKNGQIRPRIHTAGSDVRSVDYAVPKLRVLRLDVDVAKKRS